MSCLDCCYCKFPRTANDNGGACKCKIMKYKTIDVLVCAGEVPDWCPLVERVGLPANDGEDIDSHSCRANASTYGVCEVCGAIVHGSLADYELHGYDPPDTW